MAVKHGYFLKEDVGQFDAPFFSTTAKEAAALDPMKRLLLEVTYESIENGKYHAKISNLWDVPQMLTVRYSTKQLVFRYTSCSTRRPGATWVV